MNSMTQHSASRVAVAWAAAVLVTGALVAEDAITAPPDLTAPPADAERAESGLISKILQPGTGDASPRELDIVLVDYTGWTADGAMFDSSVARGKPAGLRLVTLIEGWKEGIQTMVNGEKRRFWIPEELAYGGQEGKPAGMLVFDVELIRFDRRTPAPTPPDVAAPPANAEVTKSGLATVILKASDDTRHPKSASTVTVHYTGWTTDGEMFDSSIPRGNPVAFPLTDVIKGWRQGLQLMVPGEIRRMWIPEGLAYKGKKGKPEGMLVFDVELYSTTN